MAAEDYMDFDHLSEDDLDALWGLGSGSQFRNGDPRLGAVGWGSDRHGKPWLSREEQDLKTKFSRGYTIKQLAERHGRSEVAITARLEKMGLTDSFSQRTQAPTKFEVALKGTSKVNIHHIITLLQKNYTTVNVAFPENRNTAQTYTYKVSNEIAATLKESDVVVVPTGPNNEFKSAIVVVVHPEPQIDVKKPYALKWVAQKVDLTAYNEQISREKKAIEMIQTAERRAAQERAMKVLLDNVDNVEELRQLLSNQ